MFEQGLKLLHRATINGNLQMAEALIMMEGMPVNAPFHFVAGRTALHIAATAGDEPM